VRDRLREFGIPLRPRGAPPPTGGERPSAELLRRLYVEEGKTLAEVGPLVGYSPGGVAKLLRSYGIPARPRAGRRLSDDEGLSPEQLASMYQDEGLSVAEIARRAGTTEDRVALRLRRYIRSRQDLRVARDSSGLPHAAARKLAGKCSSWIAIAAVMTRWP
jgi:hypothetical protein